MHKLMTLSLLGTNLGEVGILMLIPYINVGNRASFIVYGGQRK